MPDPLIACLAWGSLIWDPRDLPIRGEWFQDGPMIPVEFVRQSEDGRLTLVITPDSKCVRSLWAIMDVEKLDSAKNALREREGTNMNKIGCWSSSAPNPKAIPDLSVWAHCRSVKHVIWTKLGPKFDNEDDKIPSADNAISYLHSLTGKKKERAHKYIRNAPKQIDTAYRKRFEDELDWIQPHQNSN